MPWLMNQTYRRDEPGLQRFAGRSRVLYETLKSMNALPEMNMTNLAKMSGKLPIALQVKWRDEALQIRESRESPDLKDLVEFSERRAEAANDPVFGRVGEMSKSVPRKYPRSGRQTLPPVPNAAVDSKVMTMATQVGLSGSENPPTSNKDQTPTMQKGVGVKCYSCDSAHRIERCPDFIGESVRQRMILARYKGLCLNCLRVRDILLVNASHHLDANNVSNLTIPCCTKQQKTKRVQV